jgi:predicted PurR-regulated permease PerM
MPNATPNELESRKTDSDVFERRPPPREIHIHPGSPAIRSIVRVVVVTLLLLLVAGFVQSILSALTYLFFLIVLSVFFAYLIDPIVKVIRSPFKQRRIDRFMPRSLAIALAYIFVFTVVGIAIANIAPRVAEQAREFAANIPTYAQVARERSADINIRFERLRIPEEFQTEINRRVTDLGSMITTSVGNFVLVSASYLVWFILVPILAFFFLKDVNQFRLAILQMFPAGRWRYRAEAVMQDVNTTLAAYTRAQLMSCILIAIICTIGFYILGLRYALLLGILAGIFEFVPLLGPLTIATIVTLTAAASDDPWKALYAAVFLIVLRLIHDYVTYPRIVRGGLHLHPLAIILSVLAGEQVAGIPGVFLAIPFIAIATVFYRHVLEHQGGRGFVHDWIEEPAVVADEPTNDPA